jgi:hypothetical protein
MAYEIELIFRDKELNKLLRGKYMLHQSLLTVTAQDGRQKSAHFDGHNADDLAQSMLHEMEIERSH